MSFITAALIVGGTSLAAGAIGAIGASSAAGQQAQAATNAQGISQAEFNTITGQEQPYMQSGYGAQSQLNYLLGINPQTNTGQPANASAQPAMTSGGAFGAPNFNIGGNIGSLGDINIPGWSGAGGGGTGTPGTPGLTPTTSSPAGGAGSLLTPFTADMMKQYSPAYQFQMQQGQQGVLNQAAPSQGALSGSALKDLIGYNQNYANTAFNNAFNQYQTQQGNIYQRLAGVSQLGQAAAANTGQQGTALAGQAAQSAQNIGSAQAGGTVGAANALGGGLSGASLPWLLSMMKP